MNDLFNFKIPLSISMAIICSGSGIVNKLGYGYHIPLLFS
jgi:hypothetical protein